MNSLLPPLAALNNRGSTCSMCEVKGAQQLVMIPAKLTCPSGWTMQYNGWLMSFVSYQTSYDDFICVDQFVDGNGAGGGTRYSLNPVAALGVPWSNQAPKSYLRELQCVVCYK